MRKNIIKISAIALLSVFALTACDDEIIAKPTGYDDNSPVVKFEGDKKVYNNNYQDIYDAIRDGSLASDVLDKLLYQYSASVFGNYNKVTAGKASNTPEDDITLKQAVADVTKNGNQFVGGDTAKKFIKSHAAYWTKNKDGDRVDDKYNKVDDEKTADPSQSEYARLVEKWNTIEKRIAEKMYGNISGGSYSEENVFEEERFLRSLGSSIENKVAKMSDNPKVFSGVLTSKVEDEDVFDVAKGLTTDINGQPDYILHRENYQANYALNQQEAADQAITYIEDKIIPDIYRQLLVEQYILDESYDTLGRTSARHISVLKISKSNSYSKGAANLMNTFVNDYIFNKDRDYNIDLTWFKTVSNAWAGAFMSEANYATTEEYRMMSKAVPEYEVDSAEGKYFQGTAYGDMMEEIEKISTNPNLSENEGSYTGSKAYTVKTGKEIKTRELQLIDYTFTDWYLKSTGVSNLPDSIKNQLFDINVANALNNEGDTANCVEYTYDAVAGWTTNESDANRGKLINVVGRVKVPNGNGYQYFLRNTSRIKGDPVQSDILFENEGNYYIILVEDAIRSKNLAKGSQESDAAKLSKLEEYINEIVRLVANNDTYQTLSKKHWLEKMNLKYHDTVVYDYFKNNFPDLFEDD